MARSSLESLNGRTFDVVVMGGGVVGSSAAQHLSAEGYAVLLVDKGDFGSGSSSRSGRSLHCGLRYMEPGEGRPYVVSGHSPVLKFLADPKMFLSGCRRAREAMTCQAQIAGTMRARLSPETFYVPVWKGWKYRAWPPLRRLWDAEAVGAEGSAPGGPALQAIGSSWTSP